jgi:Protein of unknown function (DUF1566)
LSVSSLEAYSFNGGNVTLAADKASPIDLQSVIQNWDKKLPSASRFTLLAEFNNDGVRDNETGLVWEKSPDTAAGDWHTARFGCIIKSLGRRKGWRLPSIPELASLVDPAVASPGPTLPAGHPFTIGPSGVPTLYWSATTHMPITVDPSVAYFVDFSNGDIGGNHKSTTTDRAWCVGGGMNADQY